MKRKPKYKTIAKQAIEFMHLKSASELSRLLNCEFKTFRIIIIGAKYKEFQIQKAKGGFRLIEAPEWPLKALQQRLNKYLQALYCKIKPEASYGFVLSYKGEKQPFTIVTNAEKHLNKEYVLNIDLKDFFHSISTTRVKEFFMSSPFNFNEELASCIALICCYNKRLPMGAPTSPVISNLICIAMDNQLMALAAQNNLTYTRYADDITLSANEKIGEEVINKVKEVIVNNGFVLNEKKYRLQSKYRQQTVTGIKVNTKTNVDRRYVRNVRATLHDIKLNGLEKAAMKHYKTILIDEKLLNTFIKSVDGKINFIGQVKGKDDGVYRKLKEMAGGMEVFESKKEVV